MPDRPPAGEDDLAELRALAERLDLRPDDGPDSWDQPPAGLWERIAAEAEVEPSATEPSARELSAPAPGPIAEAPMPGAGTSSLDARRTQRSGGRRPAWFVPAAAAAAVLAAVAVGAVAIGGGDDPEVLATASLERLGAAGAGSAELLDDGGNLRLRVDTEGLDPGDGFLEVWVIDTEVSRLVSLGPLRPDGVYDLPAGLDPEAFPVVDISVEPIDGDPTHSGDSVLRGQLEF